MGPVVPPPGGGTGLVAVTPPSWALAVGNKVTLEATVRNEAGDTLSGARVTWSSTNPSVAAVDASGVVTARAVGQAMILAGSGGEVGTAAITVGDEFVPADSLGIIDSTRIVLLSDSAERATGVYRFRRVSGPMPSFDTIAVIVGAQGPGFLRRIDKATVAGDLITLETSLADITEAIKVGTFATSSQVFDDPAANVRGNTYWGPTRVLFMEDGVTGSARGGLNLSGLSLKISLDPFLSDSANFGGEASFTIDEGSITFSPRLDLGARIGLVGGFIPIPELKEFHSIFRGGVQLDVPQYTIAVQGSFTKSQDAKKKLTIARFSKRFVTFAGPVPISGELILQFKMEAAFQIAAAAELTGDFTAGFALAAGARWRKSGGWSGIASSSQNSSASPPTFGVKGSVTAKVSVVPDLFLRFYEAAGPFVNVEPYLQAVAQLSVPSYDWDARIEHGFDINGGFRVEVMKKTLAEFALNRPLYLFKLVEVFSDGPLLALDSTTGADMPPSYRLRLRPDYEVNNALFGRRHDSSFFDGRLVRAQPLELQDVRSGSNYQDVATLERVQGNCTVQSGNPGTVGVLSDLKLNTPPALGGSVDTTRARFSIFCIPFGAVNVVTATNGPDPDPDGYNIRFERLDPQGSSPKWFNDTSDVVPTPNLATTPLPVGISGTSLLDSLIPLNPRPPGNGATGAFRLNLTGVRGNCAVARPQTHDLVSYSGDTVSTTFLVQCIPLGSVQARAVTVDPDPAAPVINDAMVAGQARALGATDSAVVNGLIPLYTASGSDGRDSVSMTTRPNRCRVVGATLRQITVLSADTATVDYSVSCVERLHVGNVTSGTGQPDPDGYQVTISGRPTPIQVATNGTVGVAGLAPGRHSFQVAGLAPNCALRGHPDSIDVPALDSTLVSFAVECGAFSPPSGLVAQAGGTDRIGLQWIAAADPVHGVAGYLIYRDGVRVDSVRATNVSYVDSLLPANATHGYRVSAINGNGVESALSNQATATTLARAPTGLGATVLGADRVRLDWNRVAGIPGYGIYRNGTRQAGTVADTGTVVSGLTQATNYSFEIVALNDAGVESARSAAAVAVTDPLPPTGVTTTAVDAHSVDVRWTGVSGVVRYLVYRDGALVDSTAGAIYRDTALTANTTYSYEVEARNSVGIPGGRSAPSAVTTLAVAPTGLTATVLGAADVRLDWTAVAGITGYVVYQDGVRVAGPVAGSTFQVGGLAQATAYTFEITALNGDALESARSAPATAVTDPLPPTGLTATAVSETRVDLQWTAVAGVVRYLVYRDGSLIDSTAGGGTYGDLAAAPNTGYSYEVAGLNGAGVLGPRSQPATVTTPPGVPGNLTAVPAGESRIDLNWTAVAGPIQGYRIRRTGLDTVIGGTGFADTGLTGGTTYDYLVSALAASGLEGTAAAASATTAPPTTGGLEVETQTSGTGIPGSFLVVIEGADGFRTTSPIGPTEIQSFSGLSPQAYEVMVNNVPASCTMTPATVQTRTVVAGTVTRVTFVIACTTGAGQ